MSDSFRAEFNHGANHVALQVRDLERVLRFYHEVVGLPITRRQGPQDRPQMVWLPGVQLIRKPDEQLDELGGNFHHVGIGIDNIEEVCRRLDDAGTPVDVPLERRAQPDVNRDVMVAFYFDPEGNRVEILKYLPYS